MTTRGLGAMVLAGVIVAGCGGTTESLRVDEASDQGGSRTTRAYTFERELVRLRRDERNVTVVRGTLGVDVPDAAGPHAVRVESARYTQGDVVVRELDPALGGEPVELVQEMDGRGGAASLGADVEMLLGSEIVQVLEIIPIGSCGVAPLDSESTTFVIGFEGDQGIPREFPARCTRAAMAGVGHTALSCEASLDRPLEVSNEARSQGITASLEGRATLDATLDVATGLCTSAIHHLELSVVERMGAYEEREAVTIDVRTTLDAE